MAQMSLFLLFYMRHFLPFLGDENAILVMQILIFHLKSVKHYLQKDSLELNLKHPRNNFNTDSFSFYDFSTAFSSIYLIIYKLYNNT